MAVTVHAKLISLLLVASAWAGEGLRTDVEDRDLRRSGCSLVKGARGREGFHLVARCKCTGQVSVLSEECGEQAGERRFDLTRLPFEVDASGKSTIVPDCRCMVDESPSSSGSGTLSSRSSGSSGSSGSLSSWFSGSSSGSLAPKGRLASDSSGTLKDSKGSSMMKETCSRFEAVPRQGITTFRGCKCPEDFHLSSECGELFGLPKFNPRAKEVQSTQCRCISDWTMMRDTNLVGEVEVAEVEEVGAAPIPKTPEPEGDEPVPVRAPAPEDDKPTTGLSAAPVCKVPLPDGFAFGDVVRVVKMIPDGHFFEVMGVGFFPKTKLAGISGTIAQVVCSSGSRGSQGRVCLRKGAKGATAMGCFDPSNLEKID